MNIQTASDKLELLPDTIKMMVEPIAKRFFWMGFIFGVALTTAIVTLIVLSRNYLF